MHDAMSDGQLVQLIVCGMDEDARGPNRWQTTLSADEIREKFRGWPAHLKNGIEMVCLRLSIYPSTHKENSFFLSILQFPDSDPCSKVSFLATSHVMRLLCDELEQVARFLWEYPPARTYVSGPIAVTGDARKQPRPGKGPGPVWR
jgi:salicylate hydroxylase